MVKGISAVASAVNAFHTQCPDTKLVLVGYSQGGQIMDNAFCGGPDDSNGYTDSAPAIDSAAMDLISAVIEMGSPRFVGGLDYGVGTCTTGGFSARPSGYTCAVSLPLSLFSFVVVRVYGLPPNSQIRVRRHEEYKQLHTIEPC
jgi:acetylxylan esterase